ncbi:very short patch repair endonuclease [Mycolicibacterium iranicum]|nr:very short patch repair endonuclease [Mycolicibacterium iranicum]
MPVGADNDAPGPSAEPEFATPSPARSRNMAAIRRTDTRPELLLRSALHARGLRFRKDYAVRAEGRIIRPDVAFTRYRVAVFLDGCFWHGCPEHGRPPKSNNSYWLPKLAKNAQRDIEQTQILTEAGWTVVRLWEHVAIGDAVSTVCDALREAGAPP